MLPREEAAAGLALATGFSVAMAVFVFAPVVLTALSCFGAETGFFGFAFFAGFPNGFLAVFFAAVVFAVFFDFFAATLVFLARFFEAAALAAETFFAFFFFEGFFRATTNSL